MKQTKRISAYGIITNNDRILLCRLSPIVEQYSGQWTLPGGGLDFGEDPKVAVVREVREETGLNARVGKLLDVDSRILEFSDKHVHAIRIIYQVTVDDGELVIEDKGGSTDAVDWFRQDQLKHLPMVSLTERALELIGWNGNQLADKVTYPDLGLEPLIRYYESQENDPRSRMTADYLNEILTVSRQHSANARRRLKEMHKYPR